jgi:hypothetical protein
MARTSEPVAWISLVDVSGPFLVGAVLEQAFPQGLEKIETRRRQRLRAAYEEWQEAVEELDPQLPDLHDAWVRMVLEDCLEYDSESLTTEAGLTGKIVYRPQEHAIEYAPDFAVRGGDGAPRLLIAVYPPETSLDDPLPQEAWLASPAERMVLLCRANLCRVGLVTNGQQWMLVNAPVGEDSGYASWYARFWWQESVTLKAFQSLLGVRRCFGPEEDTLPRLLERSLGFQEEVTNTLGEQVRRAVEVLIQALGRADQDRNGELLKDIPPSELYEAGLTVMMRLVFLLSAEERGLLLLGDPIYDQNYAISTLRAKLCEDADQHGVEVLERRHDAWSRILATFRGIFGGIKHEALRLPALGGSLFDPDRFPFLEGRAPKTKWREQTAVPLPIDNRTVLLLMTALQILEQKGGALLLSYRAMDVEQIGHVYEGLLEFTAARVPEITLGLIGTKKIPNPQVKLSELESIAIKGDDTLLEHLKELTGRSLAALRKAHNAKETRGSLLSLVQASNGDETLARRLIPFGALIRADSWGSLLVYRQGSFAIVKGSGRRSSGTHYTPRSLTEPIVRYTLEPLVYVGPADGSPQHEWTLRSSADILALNVCDMACGSGAFLVEACRYLSLRLAEAWANEEAKGSQICIDGIVCENLGGHEPLPKQLDERLLIARRLVAQSCLYGVDINHLAVELAKLAIWLVTLAKSKPFSFLDHALRCGDSLVGLHDQEQLRFFSLKPDEQKRVLFKGPLNTAVDKAIDLRLKLEGKPAETVGDVEAQGRVLAQADDDVARLKCAADLLVAAEFWGDSNADKRERTRQAAVKSAYYVDKGPTEEFQQLAAKERRGQKMFHWPLEFPEVVVKRGGFDAFVGNPPFLGGKRLTTELGEAYTFGIKSLLSAQKGAADLCSFFFLRAASLLRNVGFTGLIATNSLSEGDTREVGLAALLEQGRLIIRAVKDAVWPGSAGVTVSVVYMANGTWSGACWLDNRQVARISSYLDDEAPLPDPYAIKENDGIASTGVGVNGTGFILTQEEYDAFINADPRNSDVIQPYLTSRDINQSVKSAPKRFIINFKDMSESEAKQYKMPFERVRILVKPVRDKLTRQVHEYCYWKHWDRREAYFDKVSLLERVIVSGRVSNQHAFAFMETTWLPFDGVVVFLWDDFGHFALLQSTIHEVWVRRHMTTLRKDPRYSVSDCFLTFPLASATALRDCCSFAETYIEVRSRIQNDRSLGLTDVYHLLSSRDESSAAFKQLRDLLVNLDRSVLSAYCWSDIKLEHDFHLTKHGTRFTISEVARREVLQRLLKLNHQRYAEEVMQGLHGSGGARCANRSASADQSQPPLDFEAGTEATSAKTPRQRRSRP